MYKLLIALLIAAVQFRYLVFMSCKYVYVEVSLKKLYNPLVGVIRRVSPLELWFELKICKVSNEYKVSYPGQGKIAQ